MIISYVKTDEIKTQRLGRPFTGNYNTEFAKQSITMKDNILWRRNSDDSTNEIVIENAKKIIKADRERDYKSYNKHYTFRELIYAKEYMSTDEIRFNAAERQIKGLWDNVSDEVKYEDTNISYAGDQYYLMEFSLINIAKFHNYLYNNDLEVFYEDEINNIAFSYNYLMDILPMVLIISVVLFAYNSINREINSQVAKLILTQGIPRWKYYLSKYISGVLHILFVVYIPLAIISTILGLKYGFISLKYPVFYYPRGLKYLTPRFNYVRELTNPIGFISISRLPKQLAKGSETILLGDEIISFYMFLILTMILTILFILFAVALVEFISAIINNELISFAVVAVVFLTGYRLSEPYIHERHYNLSPFTMNNAATIINGSSNVTALTSFLILLIMTIVLLTIGITYFKRKEI